MGPRRVGKSVLMQQQIQKLLRRGIPPRSIAYLSLDQPIYANLAIHELVEHIRNASALKKQRLNFLFLDDTRYLGKWENHLSAFVDAHPNIKCIASSFAAPTTGGFADFLLPPLTFHEFLDLQNIRGLVRRRNDAWICRDIGALNRHFIEYMNIGGYPEVLFSRTMQNDMDRYVRSDIIEKVLLQDLPSLYDIRDIHEFKYLFMILAWNTAQEVSLGDLSRESGVSRPTIRRYLEYLEAAFLIKVKPSRRARKFKVHLPNPSMRNALVGPVQAEDMHYFPTSLYCYLTGLRVARGEWQQQDWKIGK